MKFWGVEVKSGETLEVQCADNFILHLSQAALGECKKDKGNGSICLYVTIGGKKLVLGTLSSENVPQLSFDLVFERDFQLSHSGKNGSVHFIGYKVPQAESEEPDSDGEDLPAAALNGAPVSHSSEIKPAKEKEKPSSSGTKKVKIVEPNKDDTTTDEETDDSSDDDDDLSDDDHPADKVKLIKAESTSDDEDEDDSDDSEDTDEEEEDVTEKNVKKGSTIKKRPGPETSTPVPNKKAKMVTPQKTGGKKTSEHKATPHPAKQAAKASASNSDPKLHVCKSCNRSFGSDFALESHSKAKHITGK